MRHQLPAYSPLSGTFIRAALFDAIREGDAVLQRAEAFIASRFQADRVLLTDSGRSALQMAMVIAAQERRATTVALPAFQCFEVASAAVGAGLRIVLYDVDPHTLGPDPTSLDAALGAGADIAVIAPLYGFPVDWDAVQEIAHRHGALLIEDAAQGVGARWRGASLGAIGMLSVLSFGRGKGWTAGGGGALAARGDAALATRVDDARSSMVSGGAGAWPAAASTAQWLAGRPVVYGLLAAMPGLALGETIYHVPTSPARMTAFSAALLMLTFGLAARETEARRMRVDEWWRVLPDVARRGVPRLAPHAEPGYLRFRYSSTSCPRMIDGIGCEGRA
jgi:dTDP-4-amino-4,6-dideoxygalactose transaminase